jgi:hypothetical protein
MDDRHAFLSSDTVTGLARFVPRIVLREYTQQTSRHPAREQPTRRTGAAAKVAAGAGLGGALKAHALGQALRQQPAAMDDSRCTCECALCYANRRTGVAALGNGVAEADPDGSFEYRVYGDDDLDRAAFQPPKHCTCPLKALGGCRPNPEPDWGSGSLGLSRVPLDAACGGRAEVAMLRIRVRGFAGGDAILSGVSDFIEQVRVASRPSFSSLCRFRPPPLAHTSLPPLSPARLPPPPHRWSSSSPV